MYKGEVRKIVLTLQLVLWIIRGHVFQCGLAESEEAEL
jgi:hypothetical protein